MPPLRKLLSASIAPFLWLMAGNADASGIELTSKRLLFLDDHYLAKIENVGRQIHAARKHEQNPLLWPEKPWEGAMAVIYGSVIRDCDRYRMWYHTDGRPVGPRGIGYAESRDGVRWTKPLMNDVRINGKKSNVLVVNLAKPDEPGHLRHFYEIFGVHRDPHDPDPSRRYKMGFLTIDRDYTGPREGRFHPGQRRGLGVAGSPDGLRWTLINNWATEAVCDGDTHWMFDPVRKKYVLYGRTKLVDSGLLKHWSHDKRHSDWIEKYYWGRSVVRLESDDFLDWDFSKPAAGPVVMTQDKQDSPGTEIYSMLVFPYESVYVGLVQVFHNRPDACHLDIQLAVSHDGIKFTRVGDRSPFLPCGEIGTWDRFNQSLANNPPFLVGDELRFYYGGRTGRHPPYQGDDAGKRSGGIGMATILRDRFVSVFASFDGGSITSKPLRILGDAIHLNAVSKFGEIKVEAINAAGEVIAVSKPIQQDSLDVQVAWHSGKLPADGAPVSLRISLTNAHLYSLWSD